MAGKGDKNRVSDLNAYWNSPLWDNLKKSKDSQNKRFLFLDDKRFPQNARIHDHDKALQQYSGIANFKWDIVRTYEDFVEYVEKNGIPDVVSFDNDLVDCEDPNISVEDLSEMYSMQGWENSKYKMGAHCARWLCDLCVKIQHPLPTYYVHSANTAARPIIRGIMEAARPLIKH